MRILSFDGEAVLAHDEIAYQARAVGVVHSAYGRPPFVSRAACGDAVRGAGEPVAWVACGDGVSPCVFCRVGITMAQRQSRQEGWVEVGFVMFGYGAPAAAVAATVAYACRHCQSPRLIL